MSTSTSQITSCNVYAIYSAIKSILAHWVTNAVTFFWCVILHNCTGDKVQFCTFMLQSGLLLTLQNNLAQSGFLLLKLEKGSANLTHTHNSFEIVKCQNHNLCFLQINNPKNPLSFFPIHASNVRRKSGLAAQD